MLLSRQRARSTHREANRALASRFSVVVIHACFGKGKLQCHAPTASSLALQPRNRHTRTHDLPLSDLKSQNVASRTALPQKRMIAKSIKLAECKLGRGDRLLSRRGGGSRALLPLFTCAVVPAAAPAAAAPAAGATTGPPKLNMGTGFTCVGAAACAPAVAAVGCAAGAASAAMSASASPPATAAVEVARLMRRLALRGRGAPELAGDICAAVTAAAPPCAWYAGGCDAPAGSRRAAGEPAAKVRSCAPVGSVCCDASCAVENVAPEVAGRASCGKP